MAQMDPGSITVELVDSDGTRVGTSEKLAAHQPPGTLHRAFSAFLLDADGRLLLQRRALSKYHSPGLWTNTCCGHPFPDESPQAAVRRRLDDELGLTDVDLEEAGVVEYHVTDTISGLVEWEYNHVVVGSFRGTPVGNPDEVDQWRLVTPRDLRELRATADLTPWYSAVEPLFENSAWGSRWQATGP